MFSHVFVGVTDFARAKAFYDPLMDLIGARERFCDLSRPWAGWETSPGLRPLFVIGSPINGEPAMAGNGTMIAFQVVTRDQVDAAYALALGSGGRDEGPPGLRPAYHAHYYGAYFRDLDGNKLCVVCHTPEPDALSRPG
ncbi:VOC family protein [Roseateles terrae]|uniref:Lactoylglutathione lyase n=1 Tax=Roseateles terrae TaxID=431060 RepID=A0ABR6GTR1_9BURK|nr:VOC family protein [Roseateles terrae]MBB3195499.1 lactoylglutathione lyase [Roseateles terrae]OWQ86421.1 glyoxalase [Roseateles terrae]